MAAAARNRGDLLLHQRRALHTWCTVTATRVSGGCRHSLPPRTRIKVLDKAQAVAAHLQRVGAQALSRVEGRGRWAWGDAVGGFAAGMNFHCRKHLV